MADDCTKNAISDLLHCCCLFLQVYRHSFWKFRQDHPRTRIGEPPPYGLPGFNSGVLLLDLNRMRQSSLYNSLLDATAVSQLGDDFQFKGHLGDQDFYTLVGMRYEQLFYVLPCQWNRQLCRWWAENGYSDVFDLYHRCDGSIMVYHGNCNTPIPWAACAKSHSFTVRYIDCWECCFHLQFCCGHSSFVTLTCLWIVIEIL